MHRLVLSNCSPFLIVNAAVAEELNSSAPWSWLKLWSWMSQSPVSISEICFCFNMSSTISQSAHECSMCSMCTMCTVYNLLQNLWVFYGSSRCGPLPRWFGNHWIMDPKPNCYLYIYILQCRLSKEVTNKNWGKRLNPREKLSGIGSELCLTWADQYPQLGSAWSPVLTELR